MNDKEKAQMGRLREAIQGYQENATQHEKTVAYWQGEAQKAKDEAEGAKRDRARLATLEDRNSGLTEAAKDAQATIKRLQAEVGRLTTEHREAVAARDKAEAALVKAQNDVKDGEAAYKDVANRHLALSRQAKDDAARAKKAEAQVSALRPKKALKATA